MKNILLIILIILVSNSFGQGNETTIPGFYKFEDPIGKVVPFWYQLKDQDTVITKESTHVRKLIYRITLNYFDSLGFMYKSEKWITNGKKSKAHLVSHSDYTIEFDSIKGIQVETGHDNYRYQYYDSIKFRDDGTLEYRYKIAIRKLDGVNWDTIPRFTIQLISNRDTIKKYKIKYRAGVNSIATYYNNRPVYYNSIIYNDTISDTIIYNDHEDFTIVNYCFKNPEDSMYQIGKIDSLSNGLLQESKAFERYSSTNFQLEKYFYDKEERLVLKTASHNRFNIEVHDYGISHHDRYIRDGANWIKTTYTNFSSFPYEGWKLTKSENN